MVKRLPLPVSLPRLVEVSRLAFVGTITDVVPVVQFSDMKTAVARGVIEGEQEKKHNDEKKLHRRGITFAFAFKIIEAYLTGNEQAPQYAPRTAFQM